MGIITKEKTEYHIDDMFLVQEDINPYKETPDYADILNKLNKIEDKEEKETIKNLIQLLKTNISFTKRKEILNKIDRFIKKYHL